MAVTAQFKVNGLQELQRRLIERKEAMKRVLDMKLLQLAEEAVTHAKWNKGYSDRTANLKNSISFALYYDGELVTAQAGHIPQPTADTEGQSQVEAALDEYARKDGVVAPKGYSLIIVAGMRYGAHVEHKGYNVLYLTKYYLRDELRKILEETVEEIKKA